MGTARDLIGQNLRRIRVFKGIRQSEVANRARISRGAYQKIEGGLSIPRADTLQKLAEVLGVRIGDLMKAPPRLSMVRFRSRKKMRIRREILVRLARWLIKFNKLEEQLGEEVDFGLQFVQRDIARQGTNSEQLAIEAAAAVRRRLNLDDREVISDLCGLLESNGIKLFPISVKSNEFFGLSVGTEDGGPAIAVNVWKRLPVERWIFTAAHELGHLVLHPESFQVDQSDEIDREELEANRFASHFLMPQKAFEYHLKNAVGLGIRDCVLKLKRVFRVGYKVVLVRLIEVGVVHEAVWSTFNSLHKHGLRRKTAFTREPVPQSPDSFGMNTHYIVDRREPSELDSTDFAPSRLGRLVRDALAKEIITMAQAAEIMDMDLALTKAWAESYGTSMRT